jgi:hypothetical protein
MRKVYRDNHGKFTKALCKCNTGHCRQEMERQSLGVKNLSDLTANDYYRFFPDNFETCPDCHHYLFYKVRR